MWQVGVPSRVPWLAPGRLLLLVLLLVAHASATGAPAGDAEKTRRELSAIAKKLNALDSWFSDAGSRQRRLQKELKRTDEQIAAAGLAVRDIEQQLEAIREEMTHLASERETLEARRREQAERIADHVASAYRLTGEDFFKLLLNQQDPQSIDRMVRYHRYFAEARTTSLEEYHRTLAELDANEAAMAARATSLEEQQQERDAGIARLKAVRADRERLLLSLKGEMSDKERERERLAADRTRLERLLAELARRAEVLDGGAFAANKGRLPWPIKGTVTNSFGAPRAGGKLQWQGVFIAAEDGAPVVAVHRGRVAFADWLRGFGLVTIVEHGEGYMSLYAHADTLFKRVGDWVERGDPIATAGRSGGQNRAGIYFEIRAKGRPSDPIPWLARR